MRSRITANFQSSAPFFGTKRGPERLAPLQTGATISTLKLTTFRAPCGWASRRPDFPESYMTIGLFLSTPRWAAEARRTRFSVTLAAIATWHASEMISTLLQLACTWFTPHRTLGSGQEGIMAK